MHAKSTKLQDDHHVDKKRNDPRFQEHFMLNRLVTDKYRDEERARQLLKTDEYFSPNASSPDLNLEQPRNTNVENYNFEQHKGFTKIYDEEIEKDTYRRNEIKRILKYIKHNPEDILSRVWKKEIFYGQRAGDFEIDEFVDESVDIDGFKLSPVKNKRQVIKTKSSDDISDYDCWHSFDRQAFMNEYHRNPAATIMLSPKEVRHVFGDPVWNPSDTSTGIYNFEDTHLDLFVLAEPHSTTATRGINKDPEFYEGHRMHRDMTRRELPNYEPEEFWESEEKRKFFIFSTPYAYKRKFKKWLRREIEEKKNGPS